MFGEKEEEEEDEVGLEAIRICFILLLPVVAAATHRMRPAPPSAPTIQGIEASTALRPPVRPCAKREEEEEEEEGRADGPRRGEKCKSTRETWGGEKSSICT